MNLSRYKTKDKIALLLGAGLILFNLYALAWIPPDPYLYRGTFITICILIVALTSMPKGTVKRVIFGIFTLMALTGTLYAVIFSGKLTSQYHSANMRDVYVFFIFIIGFLAILPRVAGGSVIMVLTGLSVLYLLFGQYIPGLFGHNPLSLDFTATVLYTDISQGVFGSFTDIFVRIVSIFMIFASMLIASGLGEMFTALACRITGNSTGGPAKVTVFSSALFGMINGSPASNVMATGSFAIPLMKDAGYKPSMAASIEAIASTGGIIMPPIMGAGAFLMAEMIGVSYLVVCLAAIIPAFLWYYTCFITVHFYAQRQGIRGRRPDSAQNMAIIKGRAHLLLALVALIAGMYFFGAAEQGAFWAVVFLFALTFVRKETRLSWAKMIAFVKGYNDMFASLLLLGAAIAIFVTAVTGTGAHLKIGNLILAGFNQWYIVLLLTAAIGIVFGMGLSQLATYLSVAMIAVPILVKMGFNILAVHMFVFLIATLGPITPPVCMATFAAAKLAGTDLMKTGLEASIKSLPLWIFPFALVRKGVIFGIGTPFSTIAVETAAMCLGILMFVVGTEGFFQRRLVTPERVLATATGLIILLPVSDALSKAFCVLGLAMLAFWYVSQYRQVRRARLTGQKVPPS